MSRRRGNIAVGVALAALSVTVWLVLASRSVPVAGSTEVDVALSASGSNQADPGCKGAQNASCTGNVNDGQVKDFGLTVAPLTGLFPTGTKAVAVTFSNPHHFDIVVRTVQLSVRDAGAGCRQSHLARDSRVRTLRSPITVPRGRSVAGPSGADRLEVTLLNSAPPACQNVSFPITVTAWAEKK